MITVGIPTKGRYDSLDKTILSMIMQTMTPYEIIIVDDSDNPKDVRDIDTYQYLFALMEEKGIKWKYTFGLKKGQHYSHQYVQDIAETDFIFRIDDDEIAEPNVLQCLYKWFNDPHTGAVAPSVTLPNPRPLPEGLINKLSSIDSPNMQWFKGSGAKLVEHLYSCFMYRKGIAKFDLSLSPAAHREETLFTHSIHRAGYALIVDMDARVHHFQSKSGGIRTFSDGSLWEHDEKIFRSQLNLWGVEGSDRKIVVLDCGLGDHYAFKNILPSLKKKHKDITIAATYPRAFDDVDGIKLISIHDAKLMFGNIDNYSIYKFMIDHNWNKSLVEAFKALYEDNSIPVQPEVKERKNQPKELPVLAGGYQFIK